MPLDDVDSADREARLNAALAVYIESAEVGLTPDPAEWVARHPDLRADLEEFLALRTTLDGALTPVRRAIFGTNGPPLARPLPTRFAGYDLLEELGAGGMGVVYKARQSHPPRVVALKMIRAGRFATADDRRRFRTEAESAALLDHPRIVPVYEAGEAEGHPYLTMRLIDGGPLNGHLPGLRGRPCDAASLVLSLAEAVQHAHDRGVLHRDIKPSNVLLDSDGRPHLTDFGLAKLAGVDAVLTRTGEIIGALPYVAPELALGKPGSATTATDVYGLGAVLYACLTGGPPGRGETTAAVLECVLHGEPTRPRRIDPRVPRDLEAVCLKCLGREPGRRYTSAGAVADDLRRFLDGQPTRARPLGAAVRVVRWVRRRPGLAALAAVAFFALLGGSWMGINLAIFRSEAATQEFFAILDRVRQRRVSIEAGWTKTSLADLRRAVELPPAHGHAVELRSEAAACLCSVDLLPVGTIGDGFETYDLAYSPDGKLLALGGWATQADRGSVRLVDANNGRLERELVFPADTDASNRRGRSDGCRSLVFSPDGRWLIAASRFGGLHRWDLGIPDNNATSWKTTANLPLDIAFGITRPLLFAMVGEELYSWDSEDGWRETRLAKEIGPVGNLSVDPVRGRVSYSARGSTRLIDGRTLEPIAPASPSDWRVRESTFGPDGRMIAWYGDNHVALGDAEVGPLLQSLVVPGGMRADQAEITQCVFDPTGALLATASEWSRHVKLWDVANGQLGVDLPAGDRGSMHVAFSRSGEHLAVAANGTVTRYRVCGPACRSTVAIQPFTIQAADLARDGRALASAARVIIGPDARVEISLWPVGKRAEGRPQLTESVPPTSGAHVVAVGVGPSLVYSSNENSESTDYLYHRSAAGVSRSAATSTHASIPKSIRFAPTGRLWIATGDEVRVVSVPSWEIQGRIRVEPECGPSGTSYYAIAPGREVTLAGRRDGFVQVLDNKARVRAAWSIGKPPSSISGQSTDWEPVSAVDHFEVGNIGVAGTEKGRVALFSLTTGALSAVIPHAHRDKVGAVAADPTGQLLATGSHDRTVKLWRLDGSSLLTLSTAGPCTMLAFTPDGQELFGLVASERGVRRWHLGRLADQMRASGIDPGF